MKTNFIKHFLSFENNDTHKIIKILGIKIKFKNNNLIYTDCINNINNNLNKLQNDVNKLAQNSNNLHGKFLNKFTEISNNQHKEALSEINRHAEFIKSQIQTSEKNFKTLEQKLNKLSCLYDRFNFSSAFQISYCKEFYNDIKNADFKEKYLKLINNLDNKSIECVSKILSRIITIAEKNQSSYNIFSKEEIIQIDKIQRDFYQEIFQISQDCFAYQKYLLPVKHFEPSVFYYKHQINDVENPDYFSNKDIIDVGGFIGDSALVFSNYTTGKIFSFEPVKQNYDLMLKTIELNNCKNIIPINIALGSCDKEEKISIDESCSSITQPLERALNFETVITKSLDEYIEGKDINVGLIKVDTEGFEQEFLAGAAKTIKKFKPTLLISIYHNASDFFDIKPLIESWNLNYKFKIIKPTDGGIHLETLLIAEQQEKNTND